MRLPRRAVALLALSAAVLIGFSACGSGGSGSGGVTPGQQNAPVIASAPVTAAVQDSAYSYTLEASDPLGGRSASRSPQLQREPR